MKGVIKKIVDGKKLGFASHYSWERCERCILSLKVLTGAGLKFEAPGEGDGATLTLKNLKRIECRQSRKS